MIDIDPFDLDVRLGPAAARFVAPKGSLYVDLGKDSETRAFEIELPHLAAFAFCCVAKDVPRTFVALVPWSVAAVSDADPAEFREAVVRAARGRAKNLVYLGCDETTGTFR